MTPSPADDAMALAERVRAACLQAALTAWEDVGTQGLCAEGRWEAAISALRALPLEPLVTPPPASAG